MARKSGRLHRIASKTVADAREHAEKLLRGVETLPEAAGAAIEKLLSSSKASSASSKTSRARAAKESSPAEKKRTVKTGSSRKKSRAR